MQLKECYRYSNFLSSIMSDIFRYLQNGKNVMKYKEKHAYSKVNKGKADEDIDVVKPDNLDVNKVIHLLLKVMKEKEELSQAIYSAKAKQTCIADVELEANRNRQQVIACLKTLKERKSSEKKERGVDYTFNAEGNQISYYYDKTVVESIDYDRDLVCGTLKQLQEKSDETSSEIEKVTILTDVEFVKNFDIHSKWEDLL